MLSPSFVFEIESSVGLITPCPDLIGTQVRTHYQESPANSFSIRFLPFHHHISMCTSNRISLPARQFPRLSCIHRHLLQDCFVVGDTSRNSVLTRYQENPAIVSQSHACNTTVTIPSGQIMEFPLPTHHSQESLYSSSFAPTLFRCWVSYTSKFTTYPLQETLENFSLKCLQYHCDNSIVYRISLPTHHSLPGTFSSSFAPALFLLLGKPPTSVLTHYQDNSAKFSQSNVYHCTVSFPSGQSIEFRCKLITIKNLLIVICSNICFLG